MGVARRLLAGVALAAAALGCAATPAGGRAAAARPERLPDVEVEALATGARTRLGPLVRGRVVVLDLWATWCDACEEGLGRLSRLARAYAASDLAVIGVAVGEGRAAVARFPSVAAIPYPLYADPGFALSDALGERRVPTLLVLDRDGRIALRRSTLDGPALAAIRALLAAR